MYLFLIQPLAAISNKHVDDRDQTKTNELHSIIRKQGLITIKIFFNS